MRIPVLASLGNELKPPVLCCQGPPGQLWFIVFSLQFYDTRMFTCNYNSILLALCLHLGMHNTISFIPALLCQDPKSEKKITLEVLWRCCRSCCPSKRWLTYLLVGMCGQLDGTWTRSQEERQSKFFFRRTLNEETKILREHLSFEESLSKSWTNGGQKITGKCHTWPLGCCVGCGVTHPYLFALLCEKFQEISNSFQSEWKYLKSWCVTWDKKSVSFKRVTLSLICYVTLGNKFSWIFFRRILSSQLWDQVAHFDNLFV